MNSVDPGIWAITVLDYGWLALFSNKTCIYLHILVYFVLISNIKPVFLESL